MKPITKLVPFIRSRTLSETVYGILVTNLGESHKNECLKFNIKSHNTTVIIRSKLHRKRTEWTMFSFDGWNKPSWGWEMQRAGAGDARWVGGRRLPPTATPSPPTWTSSATWAPPTAKSAAAGTLSFWKYKHNCKHISFIYSRNNGLK